MSTLKADTIQSTGGGAATLTKQAAAKGFLHANQSTPEIENSFNVSSLTDRATGRTRANFTNGFTDDKFIMATTGKYPTGGTDGYWSCISDDTGNGTNTSTRANMAQTYGRNDDEFFWDSQDQHSVFHGDLA